MVSSDGDLAATAAWSEPDSQSQLHAQIPGTPAAITAAEAHRDGYPGKTLAKLQKYLVNGGFDGK